MENYLIFIFIFSLIFGNFFFFNMRDALRDNGYKSNYFTNQLKFYSDSFYLIKKEKNLKKKRKYIVLLLATVFFMIIFFIIFCYGIQTGME